MYTCICIVLACLSAVFGTSLKLIWDCGPLDFFWSKWNRTCLQYSFSHRVSVTEKVWEILTNLELCVEDSDCDKLDGVVEW